jgi:carbonic anhydrase
MDYLFEGIKEFQEKDFLEHKQLFSELGKRQDPHTLFIGCSDSRVVPNLITKTLPGELFVIRNIANIVPFNRESEEHLATTSAIEYAVEILKIENIVVCGHSNCGGCNALYWDEKTINTIPHTKKWLELAKPVVELVKKEIDVEKEIEKREWMTEQFNIVEQMNHLLSYDFIRDKYLKKRLNILGWYYIIETGEIFNYDKENRKFIRIG